VGVGLRIDDHLGFQGEGLRDARDGQAIVADMVAALAQRLAVDRHALQLQPDAVEHERLGMPAVTMHLEPGLHAGGRRLQRDVELDLVDQEGGRPVVGQVDGLGNIGAHGVL
jgi:hypothetical protein